jgi:hypothetical protein
MPFITDPIDLSDLLKAVETGKLQLPDFQREWKWEDGRIKNLLASVTLGYPVGVIMTLQVGGEHERFAPIPISGVNGRALSAPDELLLDGQQRMTSLYQALKSGRPVDTHDGRKKRLKRWYYLSIEDCLNPEVDREDAVFSIPEDRIVRQDFGRVVVADYSSREKEIEAGMFPLQLAFEYERMAWLMAYASASSLRLDKAKRFDEQVLKNVVSYKIPVIVLKKETPKEAVCTVFEKVNTGGVALDVFELLTATFASNNFRLKDDWTARKKKLDVHPVLRSLEGTDFLQAVSLLASWTRRDQHLRTGSLGQAPGVTCKRKDLLRLTLADYQAWGDRLTEALVKTAGFLAEEGIYQAWDLPYRTQIVPLAAVRAALGGEADTIGAGVRLRRWYWSGVLGELYGGAVETRFARDMEGLIGWLRGGEEPTTVMEASFRQARLLTLRSRLSAAYKGVYALLMKDGCQDWVRHQPLNYATFFDYQVDIHHVFPQKWCRDNGIDDLRRESIVNKTALSAATNRSIGGSSPAVYLAKVEREAKATPEQVDAAIATHHIRSDLLRGADFEAYFQARSEALLQLISAAMGKPAVREERAAVENEIAEYATEPEAELDAPLAAAPGEELE